MDALRSAPCLQLQTKQRVTSAAAKAVAANEPTDGDAAKGGHDSVDTDESKGSLMAHLESASVLHQVRQLNQPQPSHTSTDAPSITSISSNDLSHLLQQNEAVDDRLQILHQIIFPLLKNLQECYLILDNLPPSESTTPESATPQDVNEETATTNQRKKNRAKKPPLPVGMLSLNDYTNVACLLEFTISTSLLPMLEYAFVLLSPSASPASQQREIDNHTTLTTQKRSQGLPKSLSGRISKTALVWGTQVAAVNHDGLVEALSKLSGEMRQLKQNDAMRLYHTIKRYNELSLLAATVGNVILLDRFRPMLLPRHLADVILTLLLGERLKWQLGNLTKRVGSMSEGSDDTLTTMMEKEKSVERENSGMLSSLEKALLFTPLRFPSPLITNATTTASWSKIALRPIDHREAALAYRTLLGGGAAMMCITANANTVASQSQSAPLIPPWLRMRLGQCLTKLAQEDLTSVVDVFVAYAHGPGGTNEGIGSVDDVMTGAAARLARALCARPSSNDAALEVFQKRLCRQFVDFLVVEGETCMNEMKKSNHCGLGERSRSSAAMSLTLWATIGQLPLEVLQELFFRELASGLVPTSAKDDTQRLTALQSISAIWAWLSTVPSSLDPSTTNKVHDMLLSPSLLSFYRSKLSVDGLTVLGQTLRLAASFHSGAEKLESKMVVELNADEQSQKEIQQLTEMTLFQMVYILLKGREQCYSVAFELVKAINTNSWDMAGCGIELSDNSASSRVYTHSSTKDDFAEVASLRGVECRAKVLVDEVIVPLSKMAVDVLGEKEASGTDSKEHLLPSALFQLVLMLHFSSTSMAADNRNSYEKFESMMNVTGLVPYLKNHKEGERMTSTVLLGLVCEKCSPVAILLGGEAGSGVLTLLGLIVGCAASHLEGTSTDMDDTQELLSTTSIVLSLLVALLELGAEKRSNQDESQLQAMIPSLRTLSSSDTHDGFLSSRNGNPDSSQLFVLVSELAEMASHAMVLIVARHNTDETEPTTDSTVAIMKSRTEDIMETLSIAEHDLQSSQPPFRAKGVVSLRHIARSLVDAEATTPSDEVIITEIHSSTPDRSTTKVDVALVARSLARICLIALSDSESYVYLASIQTLVAIGDVCPSEIIPLIGILVAKGTAEFKVSKPDVGVSSVVLSLSSEQRIKAAEALIFMIRRRGAGVYLYGRSLLDAMVFGSQRGSYDNQDIFTKLSVSGMIQSQTHSYFVGRDANETTDNEGDNSEERKTRLNTGGPIFDNEEDALLRAASISVLCELISVIDPTVISSYCHILVGFATDALQLDSSRPIRRAAACLARVLYACVDKEVSGERQVDTSSAISVAIVSADEERLYYALLRCVTADDVDTLNSSAVKDKTRLVDTATQSRCQEAIDIRNDLESLCVFDAAKAIAQSMKIEKADPVVQAVRRALHDTP